MVFHVLAFYISWEAIMIVGSIPTVILALKTRWQYKGQYDRMRTNAMLVASSCFVCSFTFQLALDAFLDDPHTATLSQTRGDNTDSALGSIGEAFSLAMLLSSALVFFRTAIALMYDMSRGKKLGLIRVIELAGAAGFVMLVILAAVVWAMTIWYYARLSDWLTFINDNYENEAVQENPYSGHDFDAANHALLTQRKFEIAYEWIFVVFATIFLPIVFLQVMGRRTDKIAILLYTVAILLVDALHIVEVAANIVVLDQGNPLGAPEKFSNGVQISQLVCNSLFELIAIYCLAFMGMRDPKQLVGDSEPVFTPIPQNARGNEKWPEDTKYDAGAAELPTAENGLLGNDKSRAHELADDTAVAGELPGDDIAPTSQPSSKVLRFLKRG